MININALSSYTPKAKVSKLSITSEQALPHLHTEARINKNIVNEKAEIYLDDQIIRRIKGIANKSTGD